MSEPVNKTLFAALFEVQTDLQSGITKDSTNPHFKNDYADRTSILQRVLPLFQKHGLLLIQSPAPSITPTGEVVLGLTTTIVHVQSGEQFSTVAVVPLPKDDPQGYGSALTYTSRYSLTAILALPLLDDDGNAASGKGAAPAQQTTKDVTPEKPEKQATGTPTKGKTKGGVWPKSGLTT